MSFKRFFASAFQSPVPKTPFSQISKVVVVHKESSLFILQQRASRINAPQAALSSLLNDPMLIRSHKQHTETVSHVRTVLERRFPSVRVVGTSLTRNDVKWCDLVVSIGGDGTLLRASHMIDHASPNTPILGVNSAPSTSVGFFCAANKDTFSPLIHSFSQLRSSSAPSFAQSPYFTLLPLYRMRVAVNGVQLPDLILNDVLFAHECSAGTSRFWLRNGGHRMLMLSSGVWISTAAGSTGAVLAAGGEIQLTRDRRLQFVVRELPPTSICLNNHDASLETGYCESDFLLEPQSFDIRLFFDGAMIASSNLCYGDKVTVIPGQMPLLWLAPPDYELKRRTCIHQREWSVSQCVLLLRRERTELFKFISDTAFLFS